jgi:protein-disulfide isomerase
MDGQMRKMKHGSGVLLCLAMAAITCGAQTPANSSKAPIAEIGGKPVYEQEIDSRVQGRLMQLQHQEYEIKEQALESYINDQVVANQAKAEGLTSQELLSRQVDAKIPPPSDDAVRAYYVAQPSLQGRPFEQVKEQLRLTLRNALIAKARQDYIASLRAKANVQVLLQPPRFQVTYDSARLRGNPRAPVVIVEFSDFQCPYCRAAEATVRQVLAKYPDKVSLAYRDLPLSQIHPLAENAAEASRCAEEQGKFWPYHDLLMSDPPKLDQASLLADARSLDLNEKQFGSCLSTGKYAAAVQNDRDAAMALGVTGTPGFFINGTPLTGDQPLAVFEKAIQEALDSSQSAGKMSAKQ